MRRRTLRTVAVLAAVTVLVLGGLWLWTPQDKLALTCNALTVQQVGARTYSLKVEAELRHVSPEAVMATYSLGDGLVARKPLDLPVVHAFLRVGIYAVKVSLSSAHDNLVSSSPQCTSRVTMR